MITLPFVCNIEKNPDITKEVSLGLFSVPTRLSIIHVQFPNALRESSRILKYSGLTLEDSLTLETLLKSTKGVERISYNGKKYRLRNYKATYGNTVVSIELTMEQVQ